MNFIPQDSQTTELMPELVCRRRFTLRALRTLIGSSSTLERFSVFIGCGPFGVLVKAHGCFCETSLSQFSCSLRVNLSYPE